MGVAPHQQLLAIAHPFLDKDNLSNKHMWSRCSHSEKVIIYRYSHAVLRTAIQSLERKGV